MLTKAAWRWLAAGALLLAAQGDEASAHVVWVGRESGKQRKFRDAVTLRRNGSDWAVVLPTRFGEKH